MIGGTVDAMDRFFERAFAHRGPDLTQERLRQLFLEHAGAECRDRPLRLLAMGEEDPAVLAALSSRLKQAADLAHPNLTLGVPAPTILAYVINTVNDGMGHGSQPRLPVELPYEHGDSLFAHEARNADR